MLGIIVNTSEDGGDDKERGDSFDRSANDGYGLHTTLYSNKDFELTCKYNYQRNKGATDPRKEEAKDWGNHFINPVGIRGESIQDLSGRCGLEEAHRRAQNTFS